MLSDPKTFSLLREALRDSVSTPVDCVAALESRGFLFGPVLALDLSVPFVPVRKPGKLPGNVKSVTYQLEYGQVQCSGRRSLGSGNVHVRFQDTLEMRADSLRKGWKVLVVDDLLATGGTLSAACKLVRGLEAEVAQCLVVIELEGLRGRAKVDAPVHSLIQY